MLGMFKVDGPGWRKNRSNEMNNQINYNTLSPNNMESRSFKLFFSSHGTMKDEKVSHRHKTASPEMNWLADGRKIVINYFCFFVLR